MEILAIVLLHLVSVDTGKLSYYFPGDGSNAGELACGGTFTRDMVHIAYRGWWHYGCGRPVVVCSGETLSCELTQVRDAGPFGITKGRSWRVHTRLRPPRGWQWRAAADLSLGLWERLGRPSALSSVYMFFLPHEVTRVVRVLRQVHQLLHRYTTFVASA